MNAKSFGYGSGWFTIPCSQSKLVAKPNCDSNQKPPSGPREAPTGKQSSSCQRGYSSVLRALGLPDQVLKIVSIQLSDWLGALDQTSGVPEHC